MANFREVFSNHPVILPVIHVQTEAQAVENTGIAREAGCDGVFLIDMQHRGHQRLFACYQSVRSVMGNFWVGVNCLRLPPENIFDLIPKDVSGVWVDNAGVDEKKSLQTDAEIIAWRRKISGWEGIYFGGIAFKYQSPVGDLEGVTKKAIGYMDVITTSGEGTGKAPTPQKIEIMKKAAGEVPLAIASGISPENIGKYNADCFLVASSLLIPKTDNFNLNRVEALVKAARTPR